MEHGKVNKKLFSWNLVFEILINYGDIHKSLSKNIVFLVYNQFQMNETANEQQKIITTINNIEDKKKILIKISVWLKY